MAGKREDARGNGNAHVDPNHAAVRSLGKLTRIITILREDHRAVGERVGIHDADTLFKVFDAFYAEHRPENFSLANGHLRSYMVQNGMAYIEAVLISGNHDVSAVENHLGALVDALLDPVADEFFVGRGDNRAEICLFIIGRADLLLGNLLDNFIHQCVGDGFLHDDDRKGHAALARAAKGRIDDAGGCPGDGSILQDKRMVFRFAQALHPLAMLGRFAINMQADLGRTDQCNPLSSGWDRNISDSFREQVTILTTPAGKPAFSRSATILSEVMGHMLAAFSTSVLPVAMHMGIIQPMGIMAGKLKGAIPAKTPRGSLYSVVSKPGVTFMVDSPIMMVGAPQATSTGSFTFKISPFASSQFFPFSRASV